MKKIMVILFALVLLVLFQSRVFLPLDISWKNAEAELSENRTLYLRGKRLVLQEKDKVIWQSDTSWKAEDMAIMDIDHDGKKEAVVLAWARGNYGDHQPVWEKKDGIRYTKRLFLFNVEENYLSPLWMSSQLLPEPAGWYTEEDAVYLVDRKGQTTAWVWDKWGMTKKEN